MAGERGRAGSPGATAARSSDRSSILPWIIGAVVLAALLIGGIWLIGAQDDDAEGGVTNDVEVPAVEPGLVDGTDPLSENDEGAVDLEDEAGTQPLGDDDTGAGMGEEEVDVDE